MDQYEIFEAIRKGKAGGGSMLGVHVGLEPVLIRECSDTFELIVVEIKVCNTSMRVITGYGPQENWLDDEKMPFFIALEEEIAAAELEGKEVIITMDANSKLGPKYIEGDPHSMSDNGKILESIIRRHALIVANGLKRKRRGIITRQKTTVNGIEKSAIDLVLISNTLAEHLESIHTDEERNHVLTKNIKVGKVIKHIESDHNIINTKLNISWCRSENPVVEVFKYKDVEAQKYFKEETTKTTELTRIAKMNKPIEVVTNKFIKRIKGFVHKCFKKVKIKETNDKKLEEMYNKRRLLRNKTDEDSVAKLEELNDKLAHEYSEKMTKTILNEIKDMTKSDEGGLNTGKMWKLKKKLMPRNQEPPTAMENKEGKLLTDKEDIRNEAVNHYKNVFRDREIVPEFREYRKEREELCRKRLEETKQNKSKEWSHEDVMHVLKGLKIGKSKDPYDLPNELFKPGVAGEDLINATRIIMNRMKDELTVPENINVCNVTNLYKNKGDRTQYNSYRGIFRTAVLRNILEKLLYNDEYETIDSNLTDCNVGSRRGRNVRDNLFVISAIMNENKRNPKETLDINVYDVEKCFDSLWLSECINDLYESGMTSDKLNLLYQANKHANIAVKTSSGVTDSFCIKETVMQGTVWGGLMCTTTMDKLCKQIYKEDNLLYKYRGEVDVPPLQMVDDIITASKCGATSQALNTAVNTFINTKKMKLSAKKCSKIHVGNKVSKEKCQEQMIDNEALNNSEKEKYLGDFITKDASSKETIKDRKRKGYGILAEISAILKDIPLGNKRTRVGLELRHAMFLNGVLFNSETWINFNKLDIKVLEVLDHKILRMITGAHAKTPTEMLYLETGEIDIKSVITVRRLLYWQNILKRHTKELISKVYFAMKNSPKKGDWINLVSDDLEGIGMSLEIESQVQQMKKGDFKKIIKEKVRQKAFKEMNERKAIHNKVKDIVHTNVHEPKEYLTSDKVTTKQSALIMNLRSKCATDFSSNFKGMSSDGLCPLCRKEDDSQEHALTCEVSAQKLNRQEKEIKYNDLFGTLDEQLKIVKVYQKLLILRKTTTSVEPGPADRGTRNTGPSG